MQDEEITAIINNITSKLSKLLLDEFLKLPQEAQVGLILTRSAELLLINILCQVAQSRDELAQLTKEHLLDFKSLTNKCAAIGYSKKFNALKH